MIDIAIALTFAIVALMGVALCRAAQIGDEQVDAARWQEPTRGVCEPNTPTLVKSGAVGSR